MKEEQASLGALEGGLRNDLSSAALLVGERREALVAGEEGGIGVCFRASQLGAVYEVNLDLDIAHGGSDGVQSR